MKTTLDLPDPLFRELKARAAMESLKLKELVRLYIEAGLRSTSPVARDQAPRRSPLPVARKKSGPPIPAWSNEALSNMLDREDASIAE